MFIFLYSLDHCNRPKSLIRGDKEFAPRRHAPLYGKIESGAIEYGILTSTVQASPKSCSDSNNIYRNMLQTSS